MTSPQIGVGASGLIFDCPARVAIDTDQSGYRLQGLIRIQGMGIGHFLNSIDPDLLTPNQSDPIVAALVTDILGNLPLDLEIEFFRSGDQMSIVLETELARFRVIRRSAGTAIVVRLAESARFACDENQKFLDMIRGVRNQLGLADLLLAYNSGTGLTLADLTNDPQAASFPRPVQKAKWIAYAKFQTNPATISGEALKSLLGISELDAYIALGSGSNGGWTLAAALAIPKIQTQVLIAEDLYLSVQLGEGTPSFQFHGSIIFLALQNAKLTVSGDFGVGSFALSGDMELGAKAPFSNVEKSRFQGFTLENVGVLIGYDNGLTFGVHASFTMLRQAIFGAAILTLEGEIPVPRLVSGAIDPLTLPRLFQNATGYDIEGLDALDIISIDRLTFQLAKDFPLPTLEANDIQGVVTFFNANLQDESLHLVTDRSRIRQRNGGYGLVDQLHMRHYFVDGQTGTLSLQPQFYVSEISKDFGSFSVEPGIFLAGKIAVLGQSFELLLSISQSSGIVAYAKLDPFEIKFGSYTAIKLAASQNQTPSPFNLPARNLAAQLIPASPNGLVFFISASKKDVTFYFDGHLELLEIFTFDARITYLSRKLSIHTEFVWLGIHVVFQLDAGYSNFLSAGFKFRLQIDTKALTDALGAVTRAIDTAIRSLKATMASAQSALDGAQGKVNQLNNEIGNLDARIRDCQNAIQSASIWKKALVAIAMGTEIAAFEVAKVGVWTAIGIASSALKVAKLAIAAFDNLGTGLLELVNATIRAATKLLFLRSAELSAELSPTHQNFSAALSFTALGKDYDFQAAVNLDYLRNGFIDYLSQSLLNFLEKDLADIAQAKPLQSVVHGALRFEPQPEAMPNIEGAAAEIQRASGILTLLQTRYRQTFGEDLAEFTAFNANFSSALQASGNALSTARQAVDAEAFQDLLDHVRSHTSDLADEDTKKELRTALGTLDQNLSQYKEVDLALRATNTARKATAELVATRPVTERPDEESAEHDKKMVEFMRQMQDEILKAYPGTDTSYINLSLEPAMAGHFQEVYENLGAMQFMAVRRGAPTSYRPRFNVQT